MSDIELLELAAMAAGYYPIGPNEYDSGKIGGLLLAGIGGADRWNPLTDDGDALRLAVGLWIDISVTDDEAMAEVEGSGISIVENINGDAMSSTRRAIVRAAAEIGKG